MPEEEVLYTNVRFMKVNRETSERVFPSAAPTFPEVKGSRTQPPTAKPPEGPQQAEPSRTSKLTSERAALLVLSALLAAAVIALCVTTSQLERLKSSCECEKRNVTDEPCYKCEEGWEQHGGKCYNFSTRESSWIGSRDDCRAKGGDLVKIDSREEQEFLEKTLRDVNRAEERIWIGLTYSAEGRWVWEDGSPLDKSLTFWTKNQPNTTNKEHPEKQRCVGVKGDTRGFELKLKSCESRRKSICQKPAGTGHLKCVLV